MKRNLITGGFGYVGVSLARELILKGEEVIIFDLLSDSPMISDFRSDVKVIQGQLGNWAEVLEAVHSSHVDTIFHLGAMITMPAEENPWAAYNTNANGLYHILEAARHFGVEKVIWPSGIAVYAPGVGRIVNEDTYESNPSQIYAATKIFGERLGEYYHHKFNVNFRSPSFPAICGPGRRSGLAAYASLMVHDPARGIPAELPISKETQMPFIYIKDVIRCLLMIRDTDEENLSRRVYSIQGFSLSAGEMAKIVQQQIPDAVIKFNSDPKFLRLAEAAPQIIDDSRSRKDWGWKPKYSWNDTVADFIDMVNKHPEIYG